jgi:hypothetical protein
MHPSDVPMALKSFVGPRPLFSFLIFYTVGRTPWAGGGGRSVPRPSHTGEYIVNAH